MCVMPCVPPVSSKTVLTAVQGLDDVCASQTLLQLQVMLCPKRADEYPTTLTNTVSGPPLLSL